MDRESGANQGRSPLLTNAALMIAPSPLSAIVGPKPAPSPAL
ncbi:MAG: hypothetical protein O3C67_09750 [Cyanobacteria bacterium]|nr:hypothetical protein [Cyanobacteriota bacterium]